MHQETAPWRALSANQWRLELPARLVAFNAEGQPIDEFDAAYAHWQREAERIAPRENPAAFACRTVGAVKSTIRSDVPYVEVRRIGGKFLTTAFNYLSPGVAVDVTSSLDVSRERASARAEAFFAALELQRSQLLPRSRPIDLRGSLGTSLGRGLVALLIAAVIVIVLAARTPH